MNSLKIFSFTIGDALFIVLDSEGPKETTPNYIAKREKFWTDSDIQ